MPGVGCSGAGAREGPHWHFLSDLSPFDFLGPVPSSPSQNLEKAASEKRPSRAKWRHEVRATQWLAVRTALCRVRVGESWVI